MMKATLGKRERLVNRDGFPKRESVSLRPGKEKGEAARKLAHVLTIFSRAARKVAHIPTTVSIPPPTRKSKQESPER